MTWARVGARKNHLCKTFTTTFNWWLVRVTLMVAFDFLRQNFGRWQGPANHPFVILWMEVQWWGYHEVGRHSTPCHMLKNLFDPITLKDNGGRKTRTKGLALTPTSYLVNFHYLIFMLSSFSIYKMFFWISGVYLFALISFLSFLYSSHSMNPYLKWMVRILK